MHNKGLAKDYLKRSISRLKALKTLYDDGNWPDVIRESQETVELCLKALLREYGIEAPRIHDVSNILAENKSLFPKELQKEIPKLGKISKNLRRDREIAFYGSEDLTPSEFYTVEDAKAAMADTRFVVETVKSFFH